MNEPRRLLDDPSSSDEEKQLLGALSAPTVLADPARSAVAARVTKSLAAPAAAAKLLSLKALGVAAAVVAGGAALSFALLTSEKSESPAPHVAHPPAVVQAPPEAPLKAEVPEAVEALPAEAPPSTPKSSSGRQAARADTLALEETLLEQARSSIGTPSRALALLHEHERRFPNGMLTAERLYLMAQAHSRAGNQDAARRYAKLLQTRFPKSTYLEQLRSLL